MLINVKMPRIVGILTFMSRINFVLSWVYKKFYNLGAWCPCMLPLNEIALIDVKYLKFIVLGKSSLLCNAKFSVKKKRSNPKTKELNEPVGLSDVALSKVLQWHPYTSAANILVSSSTNITSVWPSWERSIARADDVFWFPGQLQGEFTARRWRLTSENNFVIFSPDISLW